MNGQWGTVGNSNIAQKLQELEIRTPATHGMNYMNMGNGNSHNVQQNRISPQFSPSGKAGFAVKAIYDYNAQDKDEISFLEGDIIVNCEKVDEGWMTGTVQRTLQWGMLPANYVQPHKIPTGLHRIK
ncbi:hypothetical protein WR25_08633 [Diploscapter pachys]|nr:hypothetical protein WR25_08633 [Diploscapter pachys]